VFDLYRGLSPLGYGIACQLTFRVELATGACAPGYGNKSAGIRPNPPNPRTEYGSRLTVYGSCFSTTESTHNMSIEFLVVQGESGAQKADVLIVGHFEEDGLPAGAAEWVDKTLEGAIARLIASGDFTGKAGSTALLYTNGKIPAERLVVVGLGKAEKFTMRTARAAAAAAAKRIAKLKGVKSALFATSGAGLLGPERAAQALAEGIVLATYQVPSYKREKPESMLAKVIVVEYHDEQVEAIRTGVERGRIIAEGQNSARDYSNEPPNVLNPVEFANRAKTMAKKTGLKATVLGEKEMTSEKMGILLAVSRGSQNEAQFIILEHKPSRRSKEQPIVLVGKGITFDTGGISIKPSANMEEMKHDMSGAAAVVGAMEAIARLKIDRHVIGIAVAVENMPDGNAFRPGDILTGITGKSTEILSTDAEGRLILADALGYVKRYNPAAVVDLATLTGAIGIALGNQAAGLFDNDAALQAELLAAADRSGERLWAMPMYEEYADLIKSEMAEVRNSAGRTAGVSSSAKFIEHFTEGYPWAHLDIASMAWVTSEREAVNPKGATGYGVRLLVEYVQENASKTSEK